MNINRNPKPSGRCVVIAPKGQFKKFASSVIEAPQAFTEAEVLAVFAQLIRRGEEIRAGQKSSGEMATRVAEDNTTLERKVV